MFNILQICDDGYCQLMLGMSVPSRLEAEQHLLRYTDNAESRDRARVRNGYPPLNAAYQVVETEAAFSHDFPRELAVMSLAMSPINLNETD